MEHSGPETQMAGSLATFALAAERFPLVPLPLGGVRVTGYLATIPGDIHGDFEIFQIACVTAAAAVLSISS
ncbi:MAG: hypothetical protein RIR77_379 [Planctomycetota bacterium]|jgi:hypothetical protein